MKNQSVLDAYGEPPQKFQAVLADLAYADFGQKVFDHTFRKGTLPKEGLTVDKQGDFLYST